MRTIITRTSVRHAALLGVGTTLGLVLSACGSASDPSSTAGASGTSGGGSGAGASATTISVVASTDVWGDVAKQVAGDLAGSTVAITSIISDPSADPHSYEASTQNLLALSKADLVIENGGGYDDFVHSMLSSADNSSATVLDAVRISGKQPDADGELNEHVWYDFPTVQKVATRIERAMSAADPADAATYRSNLRAFTQQLTGMEHTEARIRHAHGGDGVAITEPVPLYLLESCGLVNRTPPAFSEAVEEGTDASPLVLQEAEDVLTHDRVRLLAYNEQTTGAETEAVLSAAKAGGVAVVPVTETLPAGEDYVSWMRANLRAIDRALG